MARLRNLAGALLIALAINARGADADYKTVRIETVGDAVVVRLPLTDVTGKVRLKQRHPGGLSVPVSPLHTSLNADDFLEWQIGYDSLDAHHPSVAAGVRFQRKGETKYGIELAKILVEALRLGLISRDQLLHARAFLARSHDANLETEEKITVEKSAHEDVPGGFEKSVEQVPIFSKEDAHGRVEIELKPKQRAVGNQAMIYVCLNMAELRTPAGGPRPTGPAHSKETVTYRFTKENADFLLDIVSAFGIASQQHNEDLTQILDCILADS